MKKSKVAFVEIVRDDELKKKEEAVSKAVNQLYPGCGPVALYRTADGQVGFQLHLTLASGDKKRLDQLYATVMRALGERRGRPAGVKTVQTKLWLPEPVYEDLKQAAEESRSTMSRVVAECIVSRLRRRPRSRTAGVRRGD